MYIHLLYLFYPVHGDRVRQEIYKQIFYSNNVVHFLRKKRMFKTQESSLLNKIVNMTLLAIELDWLISIILLKLLSAYWRYFYYMVTIISNLEQVLKLKLITFYGNPIIPVSWFFQSLSHYFSEISWKIWQMINIF